MKRAEILGWAGTAAVLGAYALASYGFVLAEGWLFQVPDALRSDRPDSDCGCMKAPIVPIHVHDAVRRHARQVKPGKEIVGTLFVKRGVVKRYVRRRNLCRNLWSFSVQGIGEGIRPGESAVLIHSHPGPGYDHPSPGDLKQATSRVLRKPYAIYNNETDTIAFFKISRRSYKRLKPPYKRLPKP